MKNNLNTTVFSVITLVLLAVTFISARWEFIGALIGYGMGYFNAEYLTRSILSGVDQDIKRAVRKAQFSFIYRWGFITLVIVAVGKSHKTWLPDLAVGLAVGLFLSLILKYYQYNKANSK